MITIGFDEWGYNYQGHLFSGGYCDAYRDAVWCQAWRDVDALIQEGKAKPYEKAVGLLSRLKDLAEYQGREAAFQERLNQIYDQYARRKALLRRLRDAGLTEG